MAGGIILETLALVVWNIGTRTPVMFLRDLSSALRRRRGIFAGIMSFIVGAIFAVAGVVLMLPAIPNPSLELIPVEFGSIVAALAIELLIGPDLRRLAGSPNSPS